MTTMIELASIEPGVVRRQLYLVYLINFGTPLSGRRLTLTIWLALMSELLIKFSNFFDLGDSEPNELCVWLLANDQFYRDSILG